MSDKADAQVFVVTSIEAETDSTPVERGLGGSIKNTVRAVNVSTLRENMGQFFDQLQEMLASGKGKIGEFEISQVEVSAQITAGGEVCILGSGMKAEAQGGIKFVLKRKS